MARNAASPIEAFGLPGDRTVIMGAPDRALTVPAD